ncbi:MAG: hypothetical protein ACOH17_01075 [Cellulomonas sp.]
MRTHVDSAQAVAAAQAVTTTAAVEDAQRRHDQMTATRADLAAAQTAGAQISAQAAALRAEVAAANRALDTEPTHGQQRVDDVRAMMNEEISRNRTELDTARRPSKA